MTPDEAPAAAGSAVPEDSGSAARAAGMGPRPIFAFSSASALSEPTPASSALNYGCSVSPASSPPSSVEASASASI